MQYVQVVPKLKISLKEDFFTYKIPAEFLPGIRVGQLVEVNFAGRKIQGIVYKIIKRSSAKIDKTKIKNINRILYPQSIITSKTFSLAREISQTYLTSFSKALFSIIEIPVLRKIKTNIEKIDLEIPENISKKLTKISKILSKIDKAKKSALIILPEINLSKIYYEFLKSKLKNVYLFHHELNKGRKWNIYSRALNNEQMIVIGTQTGAYLPIDNLKFALIDFCDLEGFKSDQTPKIDCRDFLIGLKKYQNFKLVFRGAGLPIKYLLKYKQKQFSFIKEKQTAKLFLLEKDYKNILSQTLLENINQSIKEKKKLFILINQKGYAQSLYCQDCENIITCPKCNRPLGLISKNILYCTNCNHQLGTINSCPNCKGNRLTAISYGIDFYKNAISKYFPKSKILTIYKDHENNDIKNADIVIGTLKIFSVYFDSFDTVIYLNPENYLFQSAYDSREKTNLIVSRLKTQSEKLFLYFDQRYRDQIIEIINNKYFILSELKERKKHLFPPYAKTIKIKNRFKSETIALDKIKKLRNNLKKYYPDISDPIPLSPFVNSRGFGYSLIINSNQKYHPELKKLDKWNIEVDI